MSKIPAAEMRIHIEELAKKLADHNSISTYYWDDRYYLLDSFSHVTTFTFESIQLTGPNNTNHSFIQFQLVEIDQRSPGTGCTGGCGCCCTFFNPTFIVRHVTDACNLPLAFI